MRFLSLALLVLCGAAVAAPSPPAPLPVEGRMPSLRGAAWLNSPALTDQALRGKVVLVDFWTYSCINCLRTMPYIKAWYGKYKDHGLVVIGVHAPEFAFEKDARNVRMAIDTYRIPYPVVLDNDSRLWNAFHNQFWPAHYFIDAQGRIRAHHFGEGNYEGSEHIIRQLLAESGAKNLPPSGVTPLAATGAQAPAHSTRNLSPETYLGYKRTENFSSPEAIARDTPQSYSQPTTLKLNRWALSGLWTVHRDHAQLKDAPGKIAFRFYSRDLHLVLGPTARSPVGPRLDADGYAIRSGADSKPIRFRVRIDGAPPAADHGADIDADGNGVLREHRLYQLIRQSGDVRERTFTIEFQDPGVQAYAFTFG